LRLPDLNNMQVKTSVHESKVDQIRPGMPARILIQGRPFTGHVVSMANQPESQSFMAANVKEYATTVAVDGSPTGLRPGMTAEVTILIAEIENAVTLPITAVVEKRKGFFSYVKTAAGIEERALQIGLTNDTYIEIKDGVKEGDIVVRNCGRDPGSPKRPCSKTVRPISSRVPPPLPTMAVGAGAGAVSAADVKGAGAGAIAKVAANGDATASDPPPVRSSSKATRTATASSARTRRPSR
jgi:hypothetical protein